MNAIIGVDQPEQAEQILNLFGRVGFENSKYELVHVVDTTLPIMPIGGVPGGELPADFLEALQEGGRDALERVRQIACDRGMTTRSTLLYGPASATLLDHVNEGKPDMVGVYANLRGPLQTVIYGSTSRSLAIGSRHSILFAKGEIAPSGPLTALVAVDHSPYGAKCLGRFQQLKPTGIKKVVFVTAIDPEIADNRVLRHHLQGLETDLKQWVSAHYAKKCEDLASEFRKLGIETDYEVSDGHANDVIHRAMANHAADLLVLGAQGHSFIQRLTIGSVSMHQVTSETYPTLLMRT